MKYNKIWGCIPGKSISLQNFMPVKYALAKAQVSHCLPCLAYCVFHKKEGMLLVCCPTSLVHEKRQRKPFSASLKKPHLILCRNLKPFVFHM